MKSSILLASQPDHVVPCCCPSVQRISQWSWQPYLLVSKAPASAGFQSPGEGHPQIAKIVLIYVGIMVEVVGDIGSYFLLRSYIRYPPERISERLACLSLIILRR
jgi:hypothetical protein